MAAILDFDVASRADLLSIPLRVIMPNILLISLFAQFPCYLLHYFGGPRHKGVDRGGLHDTLW